MDGDAHEILSRFALLIGLIGAGWIARRKRWLGDPAARALSRICTDICFPALTLTQMLRVIGAWPIGDQTSLIVLGFVLLGTAVFLAWPAVRSGPPESQRTAWLSAAMPNWIFLPLPIAALVYREQGVATVLLVNVSAQFVLWTVGVAILRGFRLTFKSGWKHALNPGLVATVGGAIVAAIFPESRAWFDCEGAIGLSLRMIAAIGTLTIPLSMVVTGAQLGALNNAWRIDEQVRRVLIVRLLIAPILTVVILKLFSAVRPIAPNVFFTSALISAMPVAISCGVLVERYGGDRDLVGRAIFLSTLLSLLTVPLLMLALHAVF